MKSPNTTEGLNPMRRQRLIIGKTLAECAVLARASKQALSKYENNARTPRPSKFRDVAFAYQLSVEQLVDMFGR